jgi:uncharacterized membrane protein
VIVATALVIIWVVTPYRANGASAAFRAVKRTVASDSSPSLEVFVAADLVETVSVELTLEAVAAHALLVVVRTILSFSIEVEINGDPSLAPPRCRQSPPVGPGQSRVAVRSRRWATCGERAVVTARRGSEFSPVDC